MTTASADASSPPATTVRWPRELAVEAIEQTTARVRTFTLAAKTPGPLAPFIAGSHISVQTPVGFNAYSLTSDGLAPTEYRFSVQRIDPESGGAGGSAWLHDDVRVGDSLTVAAPRSAFAPIARASKHLLIAGGIGITPILSHLTAATRWGRATQVLYCRRPDNAPHAAQVTDFAAHAEQFTHRQPFAARIAVALREQPIGTHLYVCGPAGLIDFVLASATAAGWPSSRLHSERFRAAALDGGEPFTVRLTTSGADLTVDAGQSLLAAIESAGVAVPNLCRQGVCGQCRIPLTSGRAQHRDLYLTDSEKASGTAIMPCVSRAEPGSTLEIAL